MTQVTEDPFAATTIEDDDEFGTIESTSFPKPNQLLHKLLVFRPVKVEKVPAKDDSGKLVDRWSVDTLVVEPDGSYAFYPEMYWSQAGIAKVAAAAFRDRKLRAGTLHMFPIKQTPDEYKSEADLLADEAIQFWLKRGRGNTPVPFAWGMQPATDDEQALAVKAWKAWKAENA